jgi:hypothetical protein
MSRVCSTGRCVHAQSASSLLKQIQRRKERTSSFLGGGSAGDKNKYKGDGSSSSSRVNPKEQPEFKNDPLYHQVTLVRPGTTTTTDTKRYNNNNKQRGKGNEQENQEDERYWVGRMDSELEVTSFVRESVALVAAHHKTKEKQGDICLERNPNTSVVLVGQINKLIAGLEQHVDAVCQFSTESGFPIPSALLEAFDRSFAASKSRNESDFSSDYAQLVTAWISESATWIGFFSLLRIAIDSVLAVAQ